ncbi:MAG: toll/interleukin-1 receptor domain-containing protein [Calditrichia bacterium]
MKKSIFISYSESQIEWVKSSLVPVLEAGGADVLVDYREFKSSRLMIGQMDELQDRADINLLVLTADYFESSYCRQEMERAVDRDPRFDDSILLPVKREDVALPDAMGGVFEPNYVDLQDDKIAGQWRLLMDACGASLGCDVPYWLHMNQYLAEQLVEGQSLNLVVENTYMKWRELLEHLHRNVLPEMGVLDLRSEECATRKGFVSGLLRAAGVPASVPDEPHDLTVLTVKLKRKQRSYVILKNFESLISNESFLGQTDLFQTLRTLMFTDERISILLQTEKPLKDLIPDEHPLSAFRDTRLITL